MLLGNKGPKRLTKLASRDQMGTIASKQLYGGTTRHRGLGAIFNSTRPPASRALAVCYLCAGAPVASCQITSPAAASLREADGSFQGLLPLPPHHLARLDLVRLGRVCKVLRRLIRGGDIGKAVRNGSWLVQGLGSKLWHCWSQL